MAIRREVDVLNSRFEVQDIVDKYAYDTISVPPGSNNIKFFETLGGKSDHQAAFEGDKALVKEGRLFEVRFILAQIVQHGVPFVPDKLDLGSFFDEGSFEWNVANVLFDEDILRRISGGVQLRSQVDGPLAAPLIGGFWGDARHDNVRVYSIPKVIPGGREVKFEVSWENAAGSRNTQDFDLQISMYGVELVPVREVREQEMAA